MAGAAYSPWVTRPRTLASVLLAAAGTACLAGLPACGQAEAAVAPSAWGSSLFAVVLASLLALGFFGRAWRTRRRRLFAFLGELPGGVAVYRGRRVGPFWHSSAFSRLLGSPVLLPAEGIAEADRPRFVAAFGALREQALAFDLLAA